MRIYGVTGRKNSGKTGLMVRLVGEINKRGLSVSTIKHAHHDADIDQPGRDTFHHRNAGATQVILSSPNRWALMHELRGAEEPSLGSLLERLSPVDVVLIEGYKNEGHPKIETWRPETGQELLARVNSTIRAVASKGDCHVNGLPVFDLDDTEAIADFILRDAPSFDTPIAAVAQRGEET